MRFWRACVAAFLFALPMAASGPLGLADLNGMKNLRLEPAHSLDGFNFKAGHAQFQLNHGRVSRVFLGDRCLGFCFEGEGKISYLSQAPWESAAFLYNAQHNTSLKPIKVLDRSNYINLDSSFTQAVFWTSNGPNSLGGDPAPPLDETFASLQSKFSQNGLPTVGAEMVTQAENAPNLPWLRVEMNGGSDPLVYEFDLSNTRKESLDAMRKPASSIPSLPKWLDTVELSAQPVRWDIHDPQAGAYTLTSVDVDLQQTKSTHGALTVAETIVPNGAPLRLVRFNLNHRNYGYRGWGSSFPEENVLSVKDAQGNELPFQQDEFEVLVELPVAAQPETPVHLTFKIDGDFLFRKDNTDYWQLGTDAWFPQPDLNGQMYTWHATARVKKPWQAFSCGDTVRRWEDGDYACVETRSDKPIAFGVIQAGKYEISRETRNGLTVEVASYGGASKSARTLQDIAFYAIARYQQFLGPYPYKELHILEMNSWGYGQAPPSIMFITHEAFSQIFDEENLFFSHNVRGRFIHEIAHQWWGVVVKMPSEEEQWLTESFADMSAAILLESWPKGRAEGEYRELISYWKAQAKEMSPLASIPAANRMASPDRYDAFRARTGLLYAKGPWLLYCIKNEIGDKEFLTFLKSYQANFRWKFGTTKDVAGLLSYITKKDWTPWFEENYWGTGLPDLKK